MRKLRFINPLSRITAVHVEAVGGDTALEFGGEHEVSDELADALLVNAGDWEEVAPMTKKAAKEVSDE